MEAAVESSRQAKQQRSIADEFIDELLDAESRSLTNLDPPGLMEMTANGL